MRKPHHAFVRTLVALLATAFLTFASVSRFASVTPKGVQCPTAAVQAITVAKLDCCKRVVGYEVRKPRAGEKGFLQCRCAEKRQSSTPQDAPVHFECLPPRGLVVEVPRALPPVWTHYGYAAGFSVRSDPPALRPPTLS